MVCSHWNLIVSSKKMRFVNDDGAFDNWSYAIPGTIGDRHIKVACSM